MGILLDQSLETTSTNTLLSAYENLYKQVQEGVGEAKRKLGILMPHLQEKIRTRYDYEHFTSFRTQKKIEMSEAAAQERYEDAQRIKEMLEHFEEQILQTNQ